MAMGFGYLLVTIIKKVLLNIQKMAQIGVMLVMLLMERDMEFLMMEMGFG